MNRRSVMGSWWHRCAALMIALHWAVDCRGEVAQAPRPSRVVLFVIDGLSPPAVQRVPMEQVQQLAADGVIYGAMHLPLPAHPPKDAAYPWSCSLPNPMLMAGTPFVGREGVRTSMIQHQFGGESPGAAGATAFVVNACSYEDVAGGFDVYVSLPHEPDALVVDRALALMDETRPAFMRVHLQRPGIEGEKSTRPRYAGEPWHRNIWHEGSPYLRACAEADRQLGRFVGGLKERGLWEGTLLLVCGDHGQADAGWHDPGDPASSVTPLVVAGAGVVGGRRFASCTIFDIAPTIAWALGRPAPPLGVGRVLTEAFGQGAWDAGLVTPVVELNEVLRRATALEPQRREALQRAGFLTIEQAGAWHTTEAGLDFAAFARRQGELLGAAARSE